MRFKFVRSFGVVGIGLVLVLIAVGLLGRSARIVPIAQASSDRSPQVTFRHVATSGTDVGDCLSSASPCRTIQFALDQSTPFETIKVAQGIYTDVHAFPRNDVTVTGLVTQVVYLTRSVTIRGGYTTTNWTTAYPLTQPVTLDAQQQGRVIYVTGNIAPIIEGLRLTHGSAISVSLNGGLEGGGIFIMTATVTLNNNWLVSNTASGGGGLFVRTGRVNLTDNRVFSNTASTGAGLDFVQSSGNTLQRNLIYSNTATFNGGGVFLATSSALVMTNTVIADNRLTLSGGIGPGLYIQQSTVRALHTTIARNVGGDSSGLVINLSPGQLFMTNTILVSQSIGISVTTGDIAILNGVLFYSNTVNTAGAGGITVTNAITANPSFTSDGYHLTAASAAINAGVTTSVTTDIDGETRDSLRDLGADEFVPVAVSAVGIAGPANGLVGTTYVFTSEVVPLNASQPITYVWRATNQSPVTHAGGGLSDLITYTWNVSATQRITVTANNQSGTISDTHSIAIIDNYRIYLPLALKDF